jgi:hypothetical protein
MRSRGQLAKFGSGMRSYDVSFFDCLDELD